MIKNMTIDYVSQENFEFKDLTDEVKKFVKKVKIKNGNVLVYSTHTTLAICINEKEKGIVSDFKKLMGKLIPKNDYYQHNDLSVRTENLVCQSAASDCLNGHSHCTHLLMRNSETIPIVDGEIMLGVWQRIFAIELDCCRPRKVLVQVMGD
jgi:secondary thiamine-phosphate synthase enzyme